MRIWPVILDSQPAYLTGTEGGPSILLPPIGTSTFVARLLRAFASITKNSPVILAPMEASAEYGRSMHAVCPTARIMGEPEEFGQVFSGCELSDAFLLVDPRCLTLGDSDLHTLVREYSAEPRVAHSLVAFESIAGTKDHVSFDNAGQVRGIQRFYDQTTWAV